MTTLFRGGPIFTASVPDAPDPDWVLVEGETIAAVGGGEEPSATSVVDLQGGCLLPAFCDAHVHLGATGMRQRAVDLRGMQRPEDVLDAVGSVPGTGFVLALDLEEGPAGFPTLGDVDRAVGGRPALLARADLHSCLVSSALLEGLDLEDAAIVERDDQGRLTGVLREEAAGRAWRAFEESRSRSDIEADVRSAAHSAIARGVAGVHEMFVLDWRTWESLDDLVITVSELPLEVEVYVGSMDIDEVVRRGLRFAGGDLFLDGTVGSRTAWLRAPYRDATTEGMAYADTGALTRWCIQAVEAGLGTGVHAIGDGAIDQALTAWETAARAVGDQRIRDGSHRIEHFELASDDLILRAAALGLRVCVQPVFDERWGGGSGMYADRLGPERARGMNRFSAMRASGLRLGIGSDSPITPLDPFHQCAAWMEHSAPDQREEASIALRAHLHDAWSLAGSAAGSIEPGRPAHLVVCDRDPRTAAPEELRATEVSSTWISGERVFG